MKLATVRHRGTVTWGAVVGDRFADLGRQHPDAPSLRTALERGALDPAASIDADIDLADVQLLPVVPDPQQIFCVGINYDDHRVETGRAEAAYPTIFLRLPSSLTAHGAPFVCPAESDRFDYEGELAVIIGRPGRRIAAADSWDHIAGYACFDDGSVRDWQNHTSQFTPGKNFPGTGALGPWVVTADEIDDITTSSLVTRVNGEERQKARISDMIFGIPEIIEYLSAFCELLPGDVIATGTPGGVGSRMSPPLWLQPGDLVEVEIDGVGLLRNTVAADTV